MHAVTVVSDGYQAHGIVAAESFLRHNPGARFTVVAVGCDGNVFRGRGIEVITETDLGLSDLDVRRRRYNNFEYTVSLKPTVLKTLQEDLGVTVFMDADLYTVGSYDGIETALGGRQVLLTPHLSSMLPNDGLWPSVTSILTVGVINSGFIAVTHGPDASGFLDWWEAQLVTGCRDDPKRGLYVDQRWLDLALTLFPNVRLSLDPSWNLGHWNLWGTSLRRDGHLWSVNGGPLRSFHFSGFDPRRPWLLSRHQNRIEPGDESPLEVLCQEYAAALMAAGYDRFARTKARRVDLGHRLSPLARAAAPIRSRLGRT